MVFILAIAWISSQQRLGSLIAMTTQKQVESVLGEQLTEQLTEQQIYIVNQCKNANWYCYTMSPLEIRDNWNDMVMIIRWQQLAIEHLAK